VVIGYLTALAGCVGVVVARTVVWTLGVGVGLWVGV